MVSTGILTIFKKNLDLYHIENQYFTFAKHLLVYFCKRQEKQILN